MTTQTLILNMIPHGVMPVVYASQFDEQTGAITFKLYNDTTPYTIPSGTSILVNGTKPDGTGFSYSAASYSGNTVTINVYKQMAVVAGDVRCELRLTRSSQTVGSLNFILRVEPTALDDGTISETVLPLIERAAEIASQIDEYAETVATEAANAAASASAAATSAADAAIDAANVAAQYNALETVKTNANAAAAAANAAAETLDDITATANTLAAGSNATASYDSQTGVFTFGIPKGDRGDSGITATASSFFTLYVDENGDLYAEYNDNDNPPPFWYDKDTGLLYYYTNGNIEAVSGNPVYIETAGEQEPLAMSVDIKPVQSGSGDPSPENVRPISGWTEANITRIGKNFLNVTATGQTINGVTFSVNNGVIVANGTATAGIILSIGSRRKLILGERYTFAGCPSGGSSSTYKMALANPYWTEDTGNGFTFTAVSSSVNEIRLQIANGFTANNLTFKPMIRLASNTDATFEPYNGNTYNVSFGSAGTVYGGTLDVTTGVLTVTHKYLSDDGTKNWGRNADGSFYSIGWRFSDYDLSNNGYCNYCRFAYSASLDFAHVWLRNSNDGMVNFQGGEIGTTYPDVASLKAAFAATPLQIVYPLAEPQTYQLTPQQITLLEGANTISVNDGCTINLTYIGEV